MKKIFTILVSILIFNFVIAQSEVRLQSIQLAIDLIEKALSILRGLKKEVPAPTVKYYDVIVVGAGTGGIGAAVQAAKLGSRVALLEETDWIGGQMTTAGVSTMDEIIPNVREFGIYREFVQRVKNYYAEKNKSVGTCYFDHRTMCFEPKVGQKILKDLINQTGKIDLYSRTKVTEILKSGNKVIGVKALMKKETGQQTLMTINGKVVIDATEYGDLLPLAGVKYRSGNSTNSNLNYNSCIQDITYVGIIKKYPNGVPPNLVINNPPPGYNDEVKNMFASLVAKNGWDGEGWPQKYPVSFPVHNAYRGLPDSSNPENYTSNDRYKITKTGVNWANDYPNPNYPWIPRKTLSIKYLEDPQYRKQINCEAKLTTLQFIYYIQKELGENLWSIANDEGYDTLYNTQENSCPNIPAELKDIEKQFTLMPYVRESRRLIGKYTLTARDIYPARENGFPKNAFTSSIGTAISVHDLHDCNLNEELETDLESRDDIGTPVRFQIPMEVLIPQDIDGFLVAEKNLSISRLINGSLRFQPHTMLIGQAAGALAALSAKYNIQPRYINPVLVQWELLQDKIPLSLYQYDDVNLGDSDWPYVQLVSLYNLMIGSGNFFHKNTEVTREQMAIILTNLLNLPTNNPPENPSFVDVPKSRGTYKYIEAIYKAGLTAGCTENPRRFCPDDKLIRAQTAIFLTRAMGLNVNNVIPRKIFDDVPPNSFIAPYVQLMYELGIMEPCSTQRFCPNQSETRIEIAKYLTRVLLYNAKKGLVPRVED